MPSGQLNTFNRKRNQEGLSGGLYGAVFGTRIKKKALAYRRAPLIESQGFKFRD